jgi:hypothetical protein
MEPLGGRYITTSNCHHICIMYALSLAPEMKRKGLRVPRDACLRPSPCVIHGFDAHRFTSQQAFGRSGARRTRHLHQRSRSADSGAAVFQFEAAARALQWIVETSRDNKSMYCCLAHENNKRKIVHCSHRIEA